MGLFMTILTFVVSLFLLAGLFLIIRDKIDFLEGVFLQSRYRDKITLKWYFAKGVVMLLIGVVIIIGVMHIISLGIGVNK